MALLSTNPSITRNYWGNLILTIAKTSYVDQDGLNFSIDITRSRGMIRYLLYLTACLLDIMFSVCLCAWFQENAKESHFSSFKRIIKYPKGTTNIGLWYPKGNICDLVGYFDCII